MYNRAEKLLDASLIRDYPLEDLISKYFRNAMSLSRNTAEAVEQLRTCHFLCCEGLAMLPHEIAVRGSQTVLEAISKLESLRDEIEGRLSLYGDT